MSILNKILDKLPRASKLPKLPKLPQMPKPPKPEEPDAGPDNDKNKPELDFLSPATRQQLERLLQQAKVLIEQVKVAIEPLKERLAPLVAYYKGLNKREQIIVKVGGGFVIGYLVLSITLFPYQGWRNQVIATRDAAYEEFSWLESQKPRVADTILSRGGDFNARLDVNEIFARYAPEAQIESTGEGEYTITLNEAQGTKLFNAINAIINRGGELLSVELSRPEKEATATLVAKVSI